ncbi:virulence RhuM family protein [Candidatus Saccharibacteria bacterium]|nr:virulence RhuM family protein [Candidatus Saccharibacteria bacterium]
MNKPKNLIRSSASEYLTFVASTGEQGYEVRYEDKNIWLTQKMLAEIYGVSVAAINQHIKTIFSDRELSEDSVIKNFLITAADGKQYNTKHYNLQMIIAVGFKVNNPRAVQFRKWANHIVKDYTIQGWAIDDERLKNGGTVLTQEYYDELLERIREIRLSERRFYQKITDIYATSLDYDQTAKTTRQFFAAVQNKLHWAIHRETAAETIFNRADSAKEHMGLTSWKDAPDGKIQRFDVVVAKNYLTENELKSMRRIVNAYLDLAEEKAEQKIPMTMLDWANHFEDLLKLQQKDILKDAGKITAKLAKEHALSEFEKYRVIQDQNYQSDFDKILNLPKLNKEKNL